MQTTAKKTSREYGFEPHLARKSTPVYNASMLRMRALVPVCLLVLVALSASYYWSYRSDPAMAVKKCRSEDRKDICYNSVVDETFETRGLSAAFDVLAAAYDADPSYFSTCHAEVHTLGAHAYDAFHTTGRVELTPKTTYCGYGFYHGFMEELLAENGNYAEAKDFCAYAGEVLPVPPTYTEGACYHGIGHGVTDGNDPRLWGDAARIAAPGLLLCRKVAGDNPEWQMRCASGVFNGVANLHDQGRYSVRDNNAFLLCATPGYTKTERAACYDQMNTLAMKLSGYDFKSAIRQALKISSAEDRSTAIHGIAGLYFSNVRSVRGAVFSPKEVSDVCGMTGESADHCIQWVIGGIQEFGTPGREYEDMFQLCDSPELNEKFVRGCYKNIVASTRLFYGDEVAQQVCAKVPHAYSKDACTV